MTNLYQLESDTAHPMPEGWPFEHLGEIRSPFPHCCRFKERGVFYCHDGDNCTCECHETGGPK